MYLSYYFLPRVSLNHLESYAIQNKVCKIILNARENAVDFYIKNGYKINEKSHLLFNKIQHWLMNKDL